MARRAMYNVLGTVGTNRVILRHKSGVPRENGIFNCLYMACEEDIGPTQGKRVRNGMDTYIYLCRNSKCAH